MTFDHATLMRRAAADLRAARTTASVEFVARWLDASAANAEAGRVDKNALGLALAIDRDRTYPAPATDAEQAVKDMAQRLGIKVSADPCPTPCPACRSSLAVTVTERRPEHLAQGEPR